MLLEVYWAALLLHVVSDGSFICLQFAGAGTFKMASLPHLGPDLAGGLPSFSLSMNSMELCGLLVDSMSLHGYSILELINAFGKVEGYRINVQKSLAFLYTKNKRSEREIKETIPYAIAKKEK